MNDCYLNFLVSFRALFSLDVGANLVNSKQTIGIILPDLSLLGYAVPVESFGIGLFVILFTYLIIEYNVQLLSHEKFKIAMNMLHTAHTPLILLRNQLEELKTGNLPEPLSQQVEEALGYAECIIYCNRNIATLNKVNKRIPPKTSTVNLELSTYVTSIVNQCRAHANSRQIRLTVGECSDCVSCRINENIMTAALQHLINKMILISESGCCISINVTHTMNSWQLQISNNEIAGQRAGKMFPFIPIIFPVYGYSDLWTVRKIIRLHGGKITGCRHGKAATFQIVIPTDCHCQNQSCPVLKHSSAKTKTQIDDSCESPKSDKQNTKARETSHILLVMADKLFSDYLKKTLSRYFQISVLDNPELLINTAISQNIFVLLIIMLSIFLLHLLDKKQEMKLEYEKIKVEKLQNSYNALMGQINPHFFFNSLNGLDSLIRTGEQEKPLEYLEGLSNVFRYILQSDHKTLVTLNEELNFVNAYTYLLSVRYENKLFFSIQVAEPCLPKKLPILSLLPLIENAVKHNIISMQHPLRIEIYTVSESLLVVSNPIQPKMEDYVCSGIGLKNLQGRYLMLTGENIYIEKSNGYFKVFLPLLNVLG